MSIYAYAISDVIFRRHSTRAHCKIDICFTLCLPLILQLRSILHLSVLNPRKVNKHGV